MKAISLWQPWASLVSVGAKTYETRHWTTNHRGPLAIHAAKFRIPDLARLLWQDEFAAALKCLAPNCAIVTPRFLPFGAIVATCELVDCARVENVFPGAETIFGDYTPGRFAWQLARVKRLPTPIPWKGRQGFFEVAV